MANSPTTPEQSVRERISRILGEPASGSRGQGGLPVTGTIIDYEMRFTKAGKEHLVDQLAALLDQISAERETKIREDLIALLPDRKPMPGDARAESNLQYAAALVQERKGWNAYRKAATVVLRQPTGEDIQNG